MKKRPDPRNKSEFKAGFIKVAVDQMKIGWTDEAIEKHVCENGFYKKGDTRLQAIIDEARASAGSLTLMATPPDVVRVNAKYIPQHYVLNRCGVIFTTNNKTDCLYLPAEDRRHYVAWSDLKKDDFEPEFWLDFYAWYQTGDGFEHGAAFLAERDLSKFDACALLTGWI